MKMEETLQEDVFEASAQELLEGFEQAFSVIDAAVTASIISGVPARAFLTTVCASFLSIASHGRGVSEEKTQSWFENPGEIWEPLTDACKQAIDQLAAEEGKEYEELDELEQLRQFIDLEGDEAEAETEEAVEEEQALMEMAENVLEWVLIGLKPDLPTIAVEYALLVVYIKLEALRQRAEDLDFYLARDHFYELFTAYGPVLTAQTAE